MPSAEGSDSRPEPLPEKGQRFNAPVALRDGFHWALLPHFFPGEIVLASKPSAGWMSFKSLPSYRIFFPLPFLAQGGFYITNARIILSFVLLGLASQVISIWFPPKNELQHGEHLKSFRVAKAFKRFPFLELISENSGHCWLRSRHLRTRIFQPNPERLQEIITTQFTSVT
jgi:hypothetical protein